MKSLYQCYFLELREEYENKMITNKEKFPKSNKLLLTHKSTQKYTKSSILDHCNLQESCDHNIYFLNCRLYILQS